MSVDFNIKVVSMTKEIIRYWTDMCTNSDVH